MPARAILAIVECECHCGFKWTEQELIFRENNGYSYMLDEQRCRQVIAREIVVEGTRASKRKTPICYRCVDAPFSEMGWLDGSEHAYYEGFVIPDNTPHRAAKPLGRAKSSSNAEKRAAEEAEIDKLMGDI